MIPEDEPFENDALDRKESAIVLTQLISSIDGPFVLAIDSPWGSGKSTFIKMWLQHLTNESYKVRLLNAWENDINDNPLAALLGEMKKAINESDNIEKSQQAFSRLKEISTRVFKRAVPAIVKIGTAGIIDTNDFIEDSVSSMTEQCAIDTIEEYEKKQESIYAFKKELEMFSNTVYKAEGKPLIFVIDELDRCRPNFAIEILEKAKHLFSVPNILFVLSIDKKQLGNSIKAIYGNEFDTDGYLRRFIDLTYHFPVWDREKYCRFLIERYGFSKFFSKRSNTELKTDEEELIVFTSKLFGLRDFSLRTMEQCFSQISLVLKMTPDRQYLYPVMLSFLIVLKNDNYELYSKLKHRRSSEQEILDYYYSIDNRGLFVNDHLGTILEANIVATVGYYNANRRYIENDFIDRVYGSKLKNPGVSSPEIERASKIIRTVQHLEYRDSETMLEVLFKKLDMTQRFQ